MCWSSVGWTQVLHISVRCTRVDHSVPSGTMKRVKLRSVLTRNWRTLSPASVRREEWEQDGTRTWNVHHSRIRITCRQYQQRQDRPIDHVGRGSLWRFVCRTEHVPYPIMFEVVRYLVPTPGRGTYHDSVSPFVPFPNSVGR